MGEQLGELDKPKVDFGSVMEQRSKSTLVSSDWFIEVIQMDLSLCNHICNAVHIFVKIITINNINS